MPAGNSGLLDGLKKIPAKVRELAVDGSPPGAPVGYRLRGSTSYGPPSQGTWNLGDIVPDRTGNVWTCTAGGTPGSWAPAGPRWVSILSAGADPTGATDSTNAIANATARAIATGRPLYAPAGEYSYSSTLNWKLPGLNVIGDGSGSTLFQCTANNIPLVQIAGDYQRISGLNFAYATQQTTSDTSAIAAEFGDDSVGSCFMSRFSDLIFTYSYIGLAINPAITTVAGMFSCLFEDCAVSYYAQNAVNLVGGNGSGANCTGCVFTNFYTQNGNSAAASWPVFLEYWDEITFHQLNVEHVSLASSDGIALVNVGNAVLAGVHFEEFTQSGDGYGLIYTSASSAASKTTCYGVTSRFNVFSGSTHNSVFRCYGTNGISLSVDGFLEDSSNTRSVPARYAVDFNSATNVTAYLRSFDTGNVTAQQANASTGDVVAQYNDTATFTGSASLAGLTLNSGPLLTTPAAGAIEFDGTAFYATAAASSRQVADAEQFICQSSGYTLANNTSAQALFNATTSGAATLQSSTMYFFECLFYITPITSSSHQISFGFGGTATYTSVFWNSYVGLSDNGATTASFATSASAATICAATTGTLIQAMIKGVIRVNAGGTVIPQITSTAASTAAIVQAGSYFRVTPVGSNTVTHVGDWS